MTDPTPLSANEKARLSDWAEGRTGATPVPDFIAREHVRRLLATLDAARQPDEALREVTEQYAELVVAYGRGSDLRPIIDRHAAIISERVSATLAEARQPDEALREALDAAYRERAAVVAALFRVGGYRTWRIPAPDAAGWWIVYAETPQGQVSWHVSATDIRLFDDVPVPVYPEPWDGHTTDEKYERVAALAASPAPQPALTAEALDAIEAEARTLYGLPGESHDWQDGVEWVLRRVRDAAPQPCTRPHLSTAPEDVERLAEAMLGSWEGGPGDSGMEAWVYGWAAAIARALDPEAGR